MIQVHVKVDGFPVLSKTLDLCTELKQANLNCPLQAKEYLIKQDVTIPKLPFSGNVEVQATLTDQNKAVLACADISVHL